MEPFYIKFSISDFSRFEAAEKAFARLQECKEGDHWPDTVDAWKPYFDDQALGHFWWPTEQEMEEWNRLYFSLPVDQRHIDPRLEHSWDFLSMVDAFKNGEYDLESFESVGAHEGLLTFEPFSFPYGGTGCMKAFLEAFEMSVIEERC